MDLPRQKFREVVLQLLYSEDFSKSDADLIELLEEELKISKEGLLLAHERVSNIQKELPDIDKKIGSSSASYNIERIGKVELNILRLGAFELLFDEEIPPKVVMAEAIRLCRKFGTRDSANFINAILDKIYKQYVVREQATKE